MRKNYKLFLLFVSAGVLVGVCVAPAIAQFERIPIVERRAAPTGGPRATRTVVVRKVETRVVTKTEQVAVNNLIVATEPGSKVILRLKSPKPIPLEKIAGGSGSAIFSALTPGTYSISASKDGFESAEADGIKISAQKSHTLDIPLKEITYELKIKTNLTGGDILFAPAIQKGKDASGNILSDKLGNYCVVKIQPGGEAVITDLKGGYYDIDIRPAAVEYETAARGINLPDDLDQDGTKGLQTFAITLEKKVSTETFNPTAWTSADWNMPSTWRLDRGIKVRNAEGIALPQNPRFRYYINFEMIADVKLRDEGTIGFVLRADDKNYYLLQLSGSKGQNPNTASLYTSKNGVLELINSLTTVPFAKTMSSSNGFRVIIQGNAKGFTVLINDSDTGRTDGVGVLTDQFKTFTKGAVGIAGSAKSNFEVNTFLVCNESCSK